MHLAVQSETVIATLVELLVARWSAERIVLFGSRARGDHDELSDYDLLVVVPDERYHKGLSVEIRRDLAAVPVAKDLVIATHSTFERQSPVPGTIYYEAAQEGITLYAAA